MGIHVALHHRTAYRYDREVALGPQVVRLRPAPHCRTPILSYALKITPGEHFLNWQQDPFNNYLARLVFPKKTRAFQVEVDLVADMVVINPFDFFLEPAAETFPFPYAPELAAELAPYLAPGEDGPRLQTFREALDRRAAPTVEFLVGLNRRLNREIRYLIRLEPNVQSCEETLAKGSGSCRDSSWLLVNLLRHLGLAARFVSGYLIQLAADVKPLDGPSGPEADFSDLHAWAEVYLPGAGWVGLDPTSGLLAGEGHIPLACSPAPRSAAPVTGALDPCEVDFAHAMTVRRLREAPRATRPYAEETWQAILALGDRVDEALAAQDVRLTMGGEPTFIAIDDRQGAEWNTAALGPTKRGLAADLLQRLRRRWAPGGLLHFGQGKWYPGEPLPRWALGCYWRRDGHPIWQDGRWIADESRDYGFTAREAETFIRTLAETLGVPARHVRPAYEDILHHLWQEQRLPVNLDPRDPRLADPEARARMAQAFVRGLGTVVGYVLPLQHGSWKSGPWPFRGAHLFLLPGDSPIGLRLPLESLPWAAEKDLPTDAPLDPLAERPPLPAPRTGQLFRDGRAEEVRDPSRRPQPPPFDDPQPLAGESAAWAVRTALCVQPREGRLYVFMPPVTALEGYLELAAAVEATAAATGMPVILEGYPPPFDPRLDSLKITPDPGVLEVNIHPQPDWRSLVQVTADLYTEARQARLATEKFLLDGRHTGTGGGHHIVLGGATPADSPFLRRPDLLRSLLTYWNHHPSLSYLFSGLFIGPTSQQPRVDEARQDSLYELEIAFQEMDRQTAGDRPPPPWLVDRLLRHLLVDVTGNTHRAEFCIDKLYSPDSAAGRLGLVELRAFEMPPHARMSLAQLLLLRACIAWFWQTPCRRPLVRWGTRLHDRFLLPEFVGADLTQVLDELQRAGFPMSLEFFRPHLEFRFPVHGRVMHAGVQLELRQALEPWHVLGEEPGGGGTVRYVDSSLERLQVKVTGLNDARYLVACQGRRLPLTPTGEAGAFVAGVRYRAWQPAACLHPTIGVHAPLVFDLVDTWSGRAVGGCTYHVAHPGGRNYDTFPVNAYEAEGRRLARFAPHGHTPGPLAALPPEEANPFLPCTLDLRR